jgi:hypothetical protein
VPGNQPADLPSGDHDPRWDIPWDQDELDGNVVDETVPLSDSSEPDETSANESLEDPPPPLICYNDGLACDFDDPDPNPPPYDSCSGNPFYVACDPKVCLPISGDLSIFYQTWLADATYLLGMTKAQFDEHVWFNSVSEHVSLDGSSRWFRIDYLVTFDWIIVRSSSKVAIPTGVAIEPETFTHAWDTWPANLYKGLPWKVLPLSEVRKAFASCDPGMVLDFCHIRLANRLSDQPAGFEIWGHATVDAAENRCRQFTIDLQDGTGECEDVPCEIP